MKRASLCTLLWLSVCLASGGAFPQPGQEEQEGEQKGPPRFRTEVEQVVLYAAVYDQQNQLVSSLSREDFTIYEDRVEQQITYFGKDDVPSTIGLIIDTSGSMRPHIRNVVQAVKLFLSMNHPENELFLLRFNDEVLLEENFTRDVMDIQDALDNLIVSGGTALYDAIYLGVEKAQQGSEPKKVVIVFTDGEDKDSYYSHEELLDKIRESEVQVYIVAFLDPELEKDGGFFGIFKSEKQKIEQRIQTIAEETGGKAFFPEEIGELDGSFQQIAEELRNQYRLAYISSNPTADGKWRRIDVRVEQARERGLKVRARKGYYAK